jgi:VRR-NUC domain
MTFLPTPPRLREAQFQAQVVKLAELLGWRCWHQRDSRGTRHGWPDLICIRRPRVIFAELKSDRGTLTAEQAACIALLRACDQECYVWRPQAWPEIERLLK